MNKSPICIECGNKVKIDGKGRTPQYCSMKCNGNGAVRKEKVRLTMLNRYGVTNPTYKDMDRETYKKLNNKIWLLHEHHNNQKTLEQIAYDLNIWPQAVKFWIDKHNIIHKIYGSQSTPEKNIVEYIKTSFNTPILTSNRQIIKPLELDIYLPDYKLGIEYNGKYWHSPKFIGSNSLWLLKHNNKIKACHNKGLQLLYLWEDYDNHHNLINNAMINGVIDNKLNKILKEVYNESNTSN
jgi:hypothetical protein